MELNAQIKKYRTELNLSQEELAEKVYVTRQTISMKEIISEQEISKFNYYGKIFSFHFLILIISAVPLFILLEQYAFIPFGALFGITMFWALKVEKMKKENDIQTYKEIVAFC